MATINIQTVWQVVINRLLDITPNSSTLDAKKTQVGDNNNGSMLFREFLAQNRLKYTVAVAMTCCLSFNCSPRICITKKKNKSN